MNQSNNIQSSYLFDKSTFEDRLFEEVEGGYYDDKGFYVTPEGSFWDDEGVYFNRFGYDRHGGFYDQYDKYNPGEGWNEEFECYNSELGPESEQIKDILNHNYTENLKENYDYYRRFFEDQDANEENINEEQIFGEYVKNHLQADTSAGNMMINGNFISTNENLHMNNQQNNFSHPSSVNQSANKVSIKKIETEPNKSGLNFSGYNQGNNNDINNNYQY
jgi:hypothetical protein